MIMKDLKIENIGIPIIADKAILKGSIYYTSKTPSKLIRLVVISVKSPQI